MGTVAALRQRKRRERQRDGLIVLPVEVDAVALAEALIAAKFLQPQEYDDRDALRRRLEHVIRLWCDSHA
jgi:hypothetical protein